MATGKFLRIAESEIALVVAVALLIVGDKDIFVATELFLGLESLGNKVVNRKGVIHSFHILVFIGFSIVYYKFRAKLVLHLVHVVDVILQGVDIVAVQFEELDVLAGDVDDGELGDGVDLEITLL